MADKKPDEAAAAAIGVVLKPGQIKATEDDEPPWWRFYAVVGGAAALGLIVLAVVGVMGRSTPPKGPTRPAPPEQLVALDLDDLPGDTLARHVPLPGAGVTPGEKAPGKGPARVGVRRRAGGGEALPKIEGPAQPEPKKPSGAIIYQPSGPR